MTFLEYKDNYLNVTTHNSYCTTEDKLKVESEIEQAANKALQDYTNCYKSDCKSYFYLKSINLIGAFIFTGYKLINMFNNPSKAELKIENFYPIFQFTTFFGIVSFLNSKEERCFETCCDELQLCFEKQFQDIKDNNPNLGYNYEDTCSLNEQSKYTIPSELSRETVSVYGKSPSNIITEL